MNLNNARIDILFVRVQQEKSFALRVIKNPKLAKRADKWGTTLAHEAVRCYHSLAIEAVKRPEIAKLATENGRTVAHIAVAVSLEAATEALKNPEIAKLADNKDYTVGEEALKHNSIEGTALIKEIQKFYSKLLRKHARYTKMLNVRYAKCRIK